MRESPVRYFTPEDCRLPERTQIAPVDSAESWRGTEGRATLPPLTSAAVTSCTRRRRLAHRAVRHARSERALCRMTRKSKSLAPVNKKEMSTRPRLEVAARARTPWYVFRAAGGPGELLGSSGPSMCRHLANGTLLRASGILPNSENS